MTDGSMESDWCKWPQRDWNRFVNSLNYKIKADARITELEAENKALKMALGEWAECAEYDIKMSGPKFMGWNGSSLSRCLRKSETYKARAASTLETMK